MRTDTHANITCSRRENHAEQQLYPRQKHECMTIRPESIACLMFTKCSTAQTSEFDIPKVCGQKNQRVEASERVTTNKRLTCLSHHFQPKYSPRARNSLCSSAQQGWKHQRIRKKPLHAAAPVSCTPLHASIRLIKTHFEQFTTTATSFHAVRSPAAGFNRTHHYCCAMTLLGDQFLSVTHVVKPLYAMMFVESCHAKLVDSPPPEQALEQVLSHQVGVHKGSISHSKHTMHFFQNQLSHPTLSPANCIFPNTSPSHTLH
jgi:hypothetical protein